MTFDSEELVAAYLDAIDRIDRKGPTLRSVLSLNPDAANDARRLDAERKAGKVRGALHGIPILVKDNIETADPIPTTAGSLALRDNVTRRDAPLIARLRAAGAIILGKTNLYDGYWVSNTALTPRNFLIANVLDLSLTFHVRQPDGSRMQLPARSSVRFGPSLQVTPAISNLSTAAQIEAIDIALTITN